MTTTTITNIGSVKSIQQPTLRDQFAMAALTGLCSTDSAGVFTDTSRCIAVAKSAYNYADSMIKAREEVK